MVSTQPRLWWLLQLVPGHVLFSVLIGYAQGQPNTWLDYCMGLQSVGPQDHPHTGRGPTYDVMLYRLCLVLE